MDRWIDGPKWSHFEQDTLKLCTRSKCIELAFLLQ